MPQSTTNSLFDTEFGAPTLTPTANEDTPKTFKQEIEYEGGGKEVFEAATQEELIAKLVESKKNATLKIRQQNQQLKGKPAVPDAKRVEPRKYSGKQLSQDEEFMLLQKFQTHPSQTVAQIFEAVTGLPISEFQTKMSRLDALEAAQAESIAASEFVVAHAEDYNPVPQNAQALYGFLETNGLAVTRQNLEFAYQQLSTSGLLVPIPSASAADEEEAARIEPTLAPKKKVTTGLSDRDQARQIDSVVPNVEDIFKNGTTDEAREAINRLMRQGARA